MAIKIDSFVAGSPAEKLNIPVKSMLVSVNGEEINDVLDYGFYTTSAKLDLVFRLEDGRTEKRKVLKEEYEELGIENDEFLMDKQHACRNKCIFCFIDQNPKGMRPSIYFKDDDERMSFLFGSYVTLTNLTDDDVQRIIRMKISPVNVSVHTTNSELRCRMMKNKHAGESLRHLYTLAKAGVDLNCQIVLCRGWNDGEELRKTLTELSSLYPSVGSIAVVPVGLTAHRQGLDDLLAFDAESSAAALDIIDEVASMCLEKHGERLIYASDEFYLMSGRQLPSGDFYEDYRQLENGVGMCTLLEDEFTAALRMADEPAGKVYADIVTGCAAAPLMRKLADKACRKFPGLTVNVHEVRNDFFGDSITVAGLLTATDILNQVKKENIKAERILVSESLLRREGDRFLDDITREEFEERFGMELRPVSDGADLLDAMLGE